MTAAEAAEEMVDPRWRHQDRPLVQFVMEWHRWPEQRERMIEQPPGSTDALVVAKVAAVVHALCDEATTKAPAWVHGHRVEPAIGLFGVGLSGGYGEQLQKNGPPACREHGVWFDYALVYND